MESVDTIRAAPAESISLKELSANTAWITTQTGGLAVNWPSLSKSSGRSTWIRRSSAGLSDNPPPQTTQPPSASTTLRIAGMSSATGAMTSIVSAVPAGEVIARLEVLGMR